MNRRLIYAMSGEDGSYNRTLSVVSQIGNHIECRDSIEADAFDGSGTLMLTNYGTGVDGIGIGFEGGNYRVIRHYITYDTTSITDCSDAKLSYKTDGDAERTMNICPSTHSIDLADNTQSNFTGITKSTV